MFWHLASHLIRKTVMKNPSINKQTRWEKEIDRELKNDFYLFKFTSKSLAELEIEPNSEFCTSALVKWINIFLHGNVIAAAEQRCVCIVGHKVPSSDRQRTQNTESSHLGFSNVYIVPDNVTPC